MVITINREQLLPALSTIGGIVEKKQTLPILGNFLVQITDGKMLLTATDLEIEIRTVSFIDDGENLEAFTLPARKFSDICKALPDNAEIKLTIENDKVLIHSGSSRFNIGTLPAQDYPSLEIIPAEGSFTIESRVLKNLLNSVAFSMGNQDTRHYLNGALLDILCVSAEEEEEADRVYKLHCVATNGHRLAICKYDLDNIREERQILLPRKSVFVLIRLLDDSDHDVEIEFGEGFCRFKMDETVLSTKLIDGVFPDYQRVIPKNLDKTAIINRDALRHALVRASLLSNDKYKGVKLNFSTDKLHLESNNNSQENAEEELNIDYKFDDVSIGFNAEYLLNVIHILSCIDVAIDLMDTMSSILIRNPDDENALYIVMPMRL